MANPQGPPFALIHNLCEHHEKMHLAHLEISILCRLERWKLGIDAWSNGHIQEVKCGI